MRGYAYDRRDVTGRGLANAYAQTLGTIFSSGGEKPYEVELFVAEVGDGPEDDQIYRLTYDGQVADVQRFGVMGGAADVVAGFLEERHTDGAPLEDAVRVAVSALGHTEEGDRVIPVEDLEVAVLDRTRSRPRKFSRIVPARLRELLGERGPAEPNPEPEVEHTVPAPDPDSPPPPSSGDAEPPIAPPS
jgi:proteasome alpha subunit